MTNNLSSSMPIGTGEPCSTQKSNALSQPPKEIYGKFDTLFAFLYFGLGYLFVRTFLGSNWEPGGYTQILTAFYILCVLSYAYVRHITPTRESYFWLAIMICISLPYWFYSFLHFFQFLSLIVVAAYWTMSVGGGFVDEKGSSSYLMFDCINCFAVMPFIHFSSIFSAAFNLFRFNIKKSKKTVSVLLGTAMAILALCFILPLLMRSDKNFLSTFSSLYDILMNYLHFRMSDFIIWIVPSIATACYLYSLSISAFSHGHFMIYKKDHLQKQRKAVRVVENTTISVFLYIICGVYLLFIALQASYLFSAFSGKIFGEMTYAQYARSGFFELCQVCAINIAILCACNLLVNEEDEKKVKKPYAALCVISILLLVSAGAKMIMYMAAYGLTEKRIVASIFLLWLIVVFSLCILRCFKPFNLSKCSLFCGAILYCSLCIFDVTTLVNHYNSAYGFDKEETNFHQTLDVSSF
ncbi:MAG: DUF4173 domain-containing protein [Oscillospiraceae bacterium]